MNTIEDILQQVPHYIYKLGYYLDNIINKMLDVSSRIIPSSIDYIKTLDPKTLIITVALFVFALFFDHIFRKLLRWILFLPLAFSLAFLINLLSFGAVIVPIFISRLFPVIVIDTFLGIIGVFCDFATVTLIAKLVCPFHKLGWTIALILCLLIAGDNLVSTHSYVLFNFGLLFPPDTMPPIVWWQVTLFFISSVFGAIIMLDVK